MGSYTHHKGVIVNAQPKCYHIDVLNGTNIT
jgi:hypothetical protein